MKNYDNSFSVENISDSMILHSIFIIVIDALGE